MTLLLFVPKNDVFEELFGGPLMIFTTLKDYFQKIFDPLPSPLDFSLGSFMRLVSSYTFDYVEIDCSNLSQ
jgi:hypothetical protein